jgi:hypothetical protein
MPFKNHLLLIATGCIPINGRGKPTASSLSADGFPLMAGPNFQPLDGNPTVISILRQLADGPENIMNSSCELPKFQPEEVFKYWPIPGKWQLIPSGS